MNDTKILEKGRKLLVEVELLEDYDQNKFLYYLYEGVPIPENVLKLNVIYTDTVEDIKKKMKDALEKTINEL